MVPKGWEQKKLEELCSLDAPITYGVLKPGEYFCGGIPLLQIKDLCDGSVLSNGLHLIPPELDYEYRRSRIIKNDILISLVGTIGRVAKYQSSSEANIHRNIGRIRSNQHEYLFHYLRSDDVQRGITDSASGSSQSALNLSTLRSMLILVPPVIEQKKIAKILSTWDKAISVTEKLLTNSQQQKKALMQQLLTGQKRLLDENGVRFSGDWNSSKLGDLFNFKKGKGLSKSDLSESGINKCILYGELYTKYAEIAYEVISRTNSSDGQLSEPGDILLPASTTTSGIDLANATALSEGGILLGGDINILRPKVRLSSPFLAYFLTHMKKNEISSRAQGITIIHLYGGDLKSIDIVLPSTVQEQQKIATVLSAADAEISTLEKKLACLRDEKKALMQQLLTGKRRVKVDEAVAV